MPTLEQTRKNRADRAEIAIAGIEAGMPLRRTAAALRMSPSALLDLLDANGLTERYTAAQDHHALTDKRRSRRVA